MELIHGDCLEKLKDIPDGSIDMVLTDPPYGTTACSWDTIIPLEPMWAHVKRVIKPNGAIALFGSQPFTSVLISSNMKMFKYEWIWDKKRGSNFQLANKQPMRSHENVLIWYKKSPVYNPQFWYDKPYSIKGGKRKKTIEGLVKSSAADFDPGRCIMDGKRFPQSVIPIRKDSDRVHPTQKPVALLEYLIQTYTHESETVLDFTMGSGSTGVACVETNRDFIGIELDDKYFKIAQDRIAKVKSEPRMFY